jgi:hypothetical protein
MREQLDHIVMMATRPNVVVQVVPLAVGAYHGLSGSLTLLSFPEPDDKDIAYIEHFMGALKLEKPDDIRRARMAFDRIRSQALGSDESMRLLERMRGSCKSPVDLGSPTSPERDG